ncbi:UNVERIFIED_CONTAM: hypothetical protein O8I53_10320 [Campylobacter lari]
MNKHELTTIKPAKNPTTTLDRRNFFSKAINSIVPLLVFVLKIIDNPAKHKEI